MVQPQPVLALPFPVIARWCVQGGLRDTFPGGVIFLRWNDGATSEQDIAALYSRAIGAADDPVRA
jgi:hypothetical protein